MGQYRANGENEIGELFTLEGDALARAGLSEPDLTHAPEEYPGRQPDSSAVATTLGNEWDASGNALMYTESNARAVQEWRRLENEGVLSTGGIFRAIE